MLRLRLFGPLELSASDGRDLRPLLAQPKRVAVLACIAARPAGEFVRRDTLLGLFWPELDQAAARRSLRQALHLLRTHLGPDALVSRGDEDLAVNPDQLSVDVPDFLAAAGFRRGEALELYRGDFLAGFFLSGGSVEFERWLEETRSSLRDTAARLSSVLARESEGTGDREQAVAWARRALSYEPESESALRRLMETLDRAGDRSGAIRAYEGFTRRLAQDFDQQPSAETRELVARLRIAVAAEPVAMPHLGRPRRPGRRWIAGGGLGIAALLAIVSVALPRRTTERVLAVGEVRSGDALAPALALRTLPELLATDLARIGGLAVISHPRLEAVSGQLQASGRPSNPAEAARAAGAADLIEGILYRRGGDTLRLDLRRVDAASGLVREALTVEGPDAFALADSAAARFAARIGRPKPTPGLESVTSPSLLAHDLYNQGLRTYYRDGDYTAAARLFEDALAQDTTFAMASYYLGRSREALDPAAGASDYARAVRLSAHATEQERLLIQVQWPAAQNEPRWVALAESLGARNAADPGARYAEGSARLMTGEYSRAASSFREVIRLDSLGLRYPDARCMACDAYERLVQTDIARDSMDAALRDAGAWLKSQPQAPRAWDLWADALERQERLLEALAARDTAARLRSGAGATPVDTAYFLIRGGDPDSATRILARAEHRGSTKDREDALWWRAIALRYAGRPREALREGRAILQQDAAGPDGLGLSGTPLGVSFLEAGDLAAAARIFDSAGVHSAAYRREHPGLAARHRAWGLAQRATVAAAQNDVPALRVLAESIQVEAAQSAYGRDHTLPTYVRGLILARTGQRRAAADSLKAAIFSPTEGYTRVSSELARILLVQGRPGEAIPWLQSALRGGIEASNYYLTQTDLHELLAQCFAAAGMADSARAHAAWVAHAWVRAEPEFAARKQLMERLATP